MLLLWRRHRLSQLRALQVRAGAGTPEGLSPAPMAWQDWDTAPSLAPLAVPTDLSWAVPQSPLTAPPAFGAGTPGGPPSARAGWPPGQYQLGDAPAAVSPSPLFGAGTPGGRPRRAWDGHRGSTRLV